MLGAVNVIFSLHHPPLLFWYHFIVLSHHSPIFSLIFPPTHLSTHPALFPLSTYSPNAPTSPSSTWYVPIHPSTSLSITAYPSRLFFTFKYIQFTVYPRCLTGLWSCFKMELFLTRSSSLMKLTFHISCRYTRISHCNVSRLSEGLTLGLSPIPCLT